jgi:hypothetical protein
MDFNVQCQSMVGPGLNMGELAFDYQTNTVALLQACLTNPARLIGCKTYMQTPGFNVLSGVAQDTASVGTAGSTPMPTQARGILSWQTLKRGQAYRGRNFVPFPATTAQTAPSSLPNAAYLAAIAAYGAWYLNGFTVVGADSTGVFLPCLWHNKAGKTGVPFAKTYDFITGGRFQQYWGTQKKSGDLGRLNRATIN